MLSTLPSQPGPADDDDGGGGGGGSNRLLFVAVMLWNFYA